MEHISKWINEEVKIQTIKATDMIRLPRWWLI